MNARIIDFENARAHSGDHMVRGTAAYGMVRAFAVTARDVAQTARDAHDTTPVVTAGLGRLMMGALMMGMMFKEPDELITLIVKGDGPIRAMTVTANCEGQVKGFPAEPHVFVPPKRSGKLDVGRAVGAGTLSAVRDLPGTEPYSSRVELVSGEIAEDLTHYFMVSDQVPTSVGLGVLVGRDANVDCAGGFVVQLMPDCIDEVAERIERNLESVASVTDILRAGATPNDLLERVLDGLGYRELEAQPVEFHCGCDEDRAARATMALGADELRDMIEKGETAEVFCHFCGRRHYLPVERLREMLGQQG
ncbi:MAG: Hsp33 family molecular chaperone HslO [Eggerthellaceae bacterium]|nr:Hsp33 family molecular chaperone HslO [Eggerthellaceae bacterium]